MYSEDHYRLYGMNLWIKFRCYTIILHWIKRQRRIVQSIQVLTPRMEFMNWNLIWAIVRINHVNCVDINRGYVENHKIVFLSSIYIISLAIYYFLPGEVDYSVWICRLFLAWIIPELQLWSIKDTPLTTPFCFSSTTFTNHQETRKKYV